MITPYTQAAPVTPPVSARYIFQVTRCTGNDENQLPQTGTRRRRRKTFADGSHVIVSSSGYEIFEGIPKSQKAKLKFKPRLSPSSSQSNSPGAES
jgi:hypothetical protein